MLKTFKLEISRFYRNKCVVSQCSTNQKNHIIPRYFCRNHREFGQLIVNPDNGLLLTDTLHREYDNFLWTFDIYRARFDYDRGVAQLPIVISPHHPRKSYMIRVFSEHWAEVKIESIPFLWVGYQVFLTHNFSRCDLEEEYLYFLDSTAFREIQYEPSLALEQILNFEFSPSLIIRSRNFSQEYLTIDRLKPYDQQKWLSIEEIDSELLEDYQSNFEDPYWTN